MVESHVSPVLRDLVWLLPSYDDGPQLSKLNEIAMSQGMRLDDRRGKRDGSALKDRGWLTVFDHPSAVSDVAPSRLLIVLPEQVEDLSRRLASGYDTYDAVIEASVSLAFADHLVRQGARALIYLDDDSLAADSAKSDDVRMGHQRQCSLGHYATLPVPVGAKATWSADTFRYTTRTQRSGGTPQIDLSGIGRILVHGPSIVLTPGIWKIEITFSLDTDGDAIDMRFDWGSSEAFTTFRHKVHRIGQYSVEMTREWTENEACELRVWIEHGLLHGRMEMLGAQIHRVA